MNTAMDKWAQGCLLWGKTLNPEVMTCLEDSRIMAGLA